MIIFRTKLYQNKYIDIRDYEIDKAFAKNEGIICCYHGKKMTLTPSDLKMRALLLNKTPYKSKINVGQTYYIYSFLWEPDKEMSEAEIAQIYLQ